MRVRGAEFLLVITCAVWALGCSRSERKKAEPETAPSVRVPPAKPAPGPNSQSEVRALPSREPPSEDELDPPLEPETLPAQREALLARMQKRLSLTDNQLDQLKQIFDRSKIAGQGNPRVTVHPMTRGECRKRRAEHGRLLQGDAGCEKPNMVLLYDAEKGETKSDAKVCIDQYEFPNLPCEYPVTQVSAREVVEICRAIGKRICDAHEWEGACAGTLRTPEVEYAFGQRRIMMEYLHNLERKMVWAYGPTKDHALCGTGSKKSPKCLAGGFDRCGSNTYPAGAFPRCVSPFGVYDLHGNAAEHMNLPLRPEELASRGGLGETEMKGSWFIFSSLEAHLDDCRWRAPMWHHTRVDDPLSHANYHLGFRCCRDL